MWLIKSVSCWKYQLPTTENLMLSGKKIHVNFEFRSTEDTTKDSLSFVTIRGEWFCSYVFLASKFVMMHFSQWNSAYKYGQGKTFLGYPTQMKKKLNIRYRTYHIRAKELDKFNLLSKIFFRRKWNRQFLFAPSN